jgi:hypothetical protein
MKLIASHNLKKLVESGMTEQERELLNKDMSMGKNVHEVKKSADEKWRDTLDSMKPDAPEVANINGNKAFIRVWNNGEELELTLNRLNGIEMDELEYAIGGLTAQFMNKPLGTGGADRAGGGLYSKPIKKYYSVYVMGGTVSGIDDYFRRRFGDPNKKWELRMRQKTYCRNWGKVEVSFTIH